MVGVGGAGMSGLARLAVQAGYRVSGTDRDDSDTLASLRTLGVAASAGHSAEALPPDAQALVISTAITPDNPELIEAHHRGIPVMHRAELLAELMGRHRALAVAGAHGKSTTSAMLALALGGASACIGATIPDGEGTGAVWADGPWFVAEADESDRSLLHLAPEAAILLNVDHDHHSTYASLDEVAGVFRDFVRTLPAEGLLVVGPDERARAVAEAARCEVRSVGPTGDFRPERDGDGSVLIVHEGHRVGVHLAVPGWHNHTNAACAIALADWCGVPTAVAADRLAAFTGVGRRFELRGEAAGVTVVDDYAHHPAEIAATLAAARERHTGRIVVLFQPHLYSRTRALRAELSESLGAADVAIVTEIYAAREPHDPSVSGRDLVAGIPRSTDAMFAATLDDALDAAAATVRPGDLVLTVGAGDITRLGQELLSRLKRRHRDGGDTDGPAPPRIDP
jgi:UDP-N-acetylmuramate--alanine ligase